MGKTIIITGDRNQAVFGFMRTESLFDLIPSSQKVVDHLRTSRRDLMITEITRSASDEGIKSKKE